MTKKNYLIIGITILFFIIVISVILITGNNKGNWINDIQEAQFYQMTMTDCNGREKILDNNTLNTLSDKWSVLSNNGPWTGNTSICYKKVTISYETNGIINTKQLLLIDDTSLTLIESNNSIYYTNANDIINYLNKLFNN